MPISPGSRIGPYEVTSALGAGGMGMVYRARDARLGRDVALKVLPDAFLHDRDRLARFEREGKLLASLNHPNLAVLYGIERDGDSLCLALELIEGESLAARLKRGALPPAEACEIAAQVAAGLAAAHEAGIVHRDLKPGNVMIRPDGIVKVLDFGLARGPIIPEAPADINDSPTMTGPATGAGVILGTAAYMSPEQAKGRFVDRRTDLWAWGCLVYECLTGKRAFSGDGASETIASILKNDADWSALPADTPSRVREVLAQCLHKDPRDRLRDAGDARLLLLDAISRAKDVPALPARSRRFTAVWIALAVLGIAAAAYFAMRSRSTSIGDPLATSVLLPNGLRFLNDSLATAISPDGHLLAFVARDPAGVSKLWLRSLRRDDARSMPGTEGAEQPFWSPDNTRLGFFAGGKLKTIRIATGSIEELCDVPLPRGAAWGDGVIVLQPQSTGPLMQLPDHGGPLKPATVIPAGAENVGHRFPSFLPDGRHFVYTVIPDRATVTDIEVGSIDAVPGRKVEEANYGAVYAEPGYLVFFRDGAMRARPFDVKSLQPAGPALVVPGLDFHGFSSSGSLQVSVSSNGVLVQGNVPDRPLHLTWVDRQGHATQDAQVNAPEGLYGAGMISPNGRSAVFEYGIRSTDSQMIWMIDLVRGTAQRMTFDGPNFFPVWSPDGREIAFTKQLGSGARSIWTMRADTPGSQQSRVDLAGPYNHVLSYAPDGQSIIYRSQGTETQQDIMLATLGNSPATRPLLATRFNELNGIVSPDGHWIAYLSDESGRLELYVREFPSMTRQIRVSTDGAHSTQASNIGRPMWRPDGRELVFIALDGRTLMTVDVRQVSGLLEFGTPRPLFALPSNLGSLTIAPGLDRFLLGVARDEPGRASVTVLVNWTALIERAQ